MNPAGYRIEEKKSAELNESRSQTSYKSTHSSRSSVLERAREYNRRIDEQNRRRAKSLERNSSEDVFQDDASRSSRRSLSAGRAQPSNRSTRERAMDSVRKEQQHYRAYPATSKPTPPQQILSQASTENTHPLTPASTNYTTSSHMNHPQHPSARGGAAAVAPAAASTRVTSTNNNKSQSNHRAPAAAQEHQAVVTPELLVDALSGHEDGLLAIAERLMEHYDQGYDVMGEAIIDAFADVQKLFQHVVEAAHMEGAAFEASRREEEALRKKQQGIYDEAEEAAAQEPMVSSPAGPNRHDEFIDQDVKDVLTDAIRKGTQLRDANKHTECYELFDRACNAASSLLPVDSDHRGRLQLSIARAESMSADRACAILRYAMDDVLRSGQRAIRTPLPDPSKRADVVLSRPQHATMTPGVVQSADEALNSIMEEMKEVLTAPVYQDTPLQAVAKRFWAALQEAQKASQKNEERLEHQLGKLKGDYLLAKAVCVDWLPLAYAYLSFPCSLSPSLSNLSGMGGKAQPGQ